ncbi:MAG: hypothetical protein QF613_07355 [Candidatus Marinimicrobia bacterium]|jgi:hypothetical protein|nr:hypothetical protein [Candidatus Neomarinimicrobiota bacterium]MDP6594001.1 hypothetical protein [Candidatus Neomarinimicrobiota bacterium]MDP6836836.1 hypothetical protein [Candidatus Neomarinimicrobiota bacterium]|tara:strand:- start:1988 stop:2113 length:126 start_codon:yes stop_codon:yes gene_type:complete
MKTVLRFDSGRQGFEKATYLLLILAVAIAVFGIIWVYNFLK